MLTQIIVLYVAYALDLPAWCKIFAIISISLDLVSFGYGFCEGLNKPKTDQKEV